MSTNEIVARAAELGDQMTQELIIARKLADWVTIQLAECNCTAEAMVNGFNLLEELDALSVRIEPSARDEVLGSSK